jgi:hypothetical protein
VRTGDDISRVAAVIQSSRRRVFAPRLLVLRVAHNIWQPTVARVADGATAALLDVSDPTEHLLWELRTLPHVRLVVVWELEAVHALLARDLTALSDGARHRRSDGAPLTVPRRLSSSAASRRIAPAAAAARRRANGS